VDDLENRLAKMQRQRRRWAARQGLTAYRIYDRDIPEHRYAVDWYDGYAVVVAYPSRHPRAAARQPDPETLRAVVGRGLRIVPERVFVKVRRPAARRQDQYEREASSRGVWITVIEGGLRFRVNLSDYADTGLFLDHRTTRARVREESAGKRVLNLFCYTGAFTVHAAAGGAASTVSVDLSNTYLDWALENLRVNDLDGKAHLMVRSDVLRWLGQERQRIASGKGAPFDLAILDPPSFSASKKMAATLEIQRDHPGLVAGTLALLSPGGVLYFSTNYRGFAPDWDAVGQAAIDLGAAKPASIETLTPASLPEDFRDEGIHRCYRLVAGG
jgi:23S rRNA (cytosine1962-C5)-methyltransferase